jgi:hypothetical protein
MGAENLRRGGGRGLWVSIQESRELGGGIGVDVLHNAQSAFVAI